MKYKLRYNKFSLKFDTILNKLRLIYFLFLINFIFVNLLIKKLFNFTLKKIILNKYINN